MRRTLVALAALLVVLSPAFADSLKVYGSYRYVAPVANGSFAGVSLEADAAPAWGGGFEWRLNGWGGFELDYSRVGHDLFYGDRNIGRFDAEMYGLAMNLHLVDEPRWGMYFGPLISYAEFEQTNVDNEWTPGVSAGLDLKLTQRWAATFGARYIDLELTRGISALEIDPLVGSVGLAFTFGGAGRR